MIWILYTLLTLCFVGMGLVVLENRRSLNRLERKINKIATLLKLICKCDMCGESGALTIARRYKRADGMSNGIETLLAIDTLVCDKCKKALEEKENEVD